jgi:pyruvate carboxylase subunit B
VAGRRYEVGIDGDQVTVDGVPVEARLQGTGAVRRLVRGSRSREIAASPAEDGAWRILADGYRLEAAALDARALALRASRRRAGLGAVGGVLRAPMPGLVVRVLVREGQIVEPGTGLVVLEAMKMENELTAAAGGRVSRVHVAAGDRVEKGVALIEVAAPSVDH